MVLFMQVLVKYVLQDTTVVEVLMKQQTSLL